MVFFRYSALIVLLVLLQLATVVRVFAAEIDLSTAPMQKLKVSAATGDPVAQFELGTIYAFERTDPSAAVALLKKSAEQEFSPAQTQLAMMYYRGRGVRVDREEARTWLERAARQNDSYAKIYLRVLKREAEDEARGGTVIRGNTETDESCHKLAFPHNKIAFGKRKQEPDLTPGDVYGDCVDRKEALRHMSTCAISGKWVC